MKSLYCDAKLNLEKAPNGCESHMRVGELRAALAHLPDDAHVGMGIVDQPEKLPTFRTVTADQEDNFLWLLIDTRRSKGTDPAA